jgi:hypothetical protein
LADAPRITCIDETHSNKRLAFIARQRYVAGVSFNISFSPGQTPAMIAIQSTRMLSGASALAAARQARRTESLPQGGATPSGNTTESAGSGVCSAALRVLVPALLVGGVVAFKTSFALQTAARFF